MKEDLVGNIQAYIITRKEFWQGFEKELTYKYPTTMEKQEMLRYPALRSAIKFQYWPMLAASWSYEGDDERQKKLIQNWQKRYYRGIAMETCWNSHSWGFAAGEKVLRPVKIDGRTYVTMSGVIIPPPYYTRLHFSDAPLEIDGFVWNQIPVTKEMMIYNVFQGSEISNPYGTSVLDDVYWAWDLLMKIWARFVVYLGFKAVPPFVLKYIRELEGKKEDGPQRDVAKEKAVQTAKDLRNVAALILPRWFDEETQQWFEWMANEMKIADRTGEFKDGIRLIEGLFYVGTRVPQRIVEQTLETGSYSMLQGQKDFFYDQLKVELELFEEFLRRWAIYPLLEKNFGKVNIDINLTFGDELFELYFDLLKIAVTQGQVNVDWQSVSEKVKVKLKEEAEQAEVKAQRVQGQGIEFATTTAEKRAKEKRKLQVIAKRWTEQMNAKFEPLMEKVYKGHKQDLRKEHGRIGLKLNRLFSKGQPKADALAKAVQVPRRIYSTIYPALLDGWKIGMTPVMQGAKQKVMEKPNRDANNQLKALAIAWEGLTGKHEIAGEGERLERSLFTNLSGITVKDQAMEIFDRQFSNYLDKTLVDRIGRMLRDAVRIGRFDAIEEVIKRRLEDKKNA